jgi:hypothetical protein
MPVISATASPPGLMWRMAVREVLVPGLGHDELERDFGVATGNRQRSDHVEWCWPGFCGGGIRQVW